MAVIPRRHKVIRRSQVPGGGWPFRPGHPYNQNKAGYHLVNIRGEGFVFLWVPSEEMWDTGLARYSADIMGEHDYMGECTPVFRAPPVVTSTYQPYRKWRHK